MSYLGFLLVFLVPPSILLAIRAFRRPAGKDRPRPQVGFLVAIAAIALVYTTPWDNYLVWRGVWAYGVERVLGTIGYVPIEEYLFFLLQPLLTGLWLLNLRETVPLPVSRSTRLVGALLYGAVTAVGVALLNGPDSGLYLGLILAWAAPVLALQWAYAGESIWGRWRQWAVGFAVPTLYLWACDAFALSDGIWRIAPQYTLGWHLGVLPLEEAMFFLVTNLLVVQGLMLFMYPPSSRAAAQPTETRADVIGDPLERSGAV